jgi:hypothetical protein
MSQQDIQDLLAELEVADQEELAPPLPEHGAGGAHTAYTSSSLPSDSEFGGFDPDITMQLATLQQQQQQLATVAMQKDQGQLLLERKKLEQDNLLKQLILQKNQNQVMNNNPYINQSDDRAVAQRRFMESQKLKQDEFTRAEQVSIMATEQQYLTMQTLANYKFGIPSVPGLVGQGEEYFAV